MEDWSFCQRVVEQGQVLTWEEAGLDVTELRTENTDKHLTCLQYREEQTYLLTFPIRLNSHDSLRFCKGFGGQLAVARDNETFLEMKRVFSNSLCPSGRAQFYSGYRKVNNQWLDQNTWKPLLGNIWEKNFPVNYPAYDCSYYSVASNINQLQAHF